MRATVTSFRNPSDNTGVQTQEKRNTATVPGKACPVCNQKSVLWMEPKDTAAWGQEGPR